jgi:hypothetical protein
MDIPIHSAAMCRVVHVRRSGLVGARSGFHSAVLNPEGIVSRA